MPVQVRPEALLHNEHNSVVGVKLPRAGGLLVSRKGAVTELVTLEGQWWVFINQEQDSLRVTHLAPRGKAVSRMTDLAPGTIVSRGRVISHPSNFHTSYLAEENMTDSTGRIIKNITEAAAGAQTYYIVHYKNGSCKTYTRATGVITKWLAKQN